MEGRAKTERPNVELGPGHGLVAAFVTACRSIGIYPAAHPRVAAAAGEFTTRLAAHCTSRRTAILVVRGDGLVLDEEQLKPDGSSVDWLLARYREAGLRGVEFHHECTPPDVVAFATALNKTRPRSGTDFFAHWTEKNPRLSPLPLVFQGGHDAAAAEAVAAEDGPAASAFLSEKAKADARIRAVVDRMATTPEVQRRLRAIARTSQDGNFEGTKKIDLFETIVDLLPADVARDPAVIEDVVSRILGRVEDSLSELVRRNAKVKGADLLKKALGVARKFFHTEAPKQTAPESLPSGRPEDEKIVADLGLLLQEIDQLPDASDLRLPTAAEMANAAQVVSQELIGICLHRVANSDNPATLDRLRERLQKLRSSVVAELAAVLAPYAGPGADPTASGMATRRRVLGALVDSGHASAVRAGGFVDALFVTRGFPEVLPLAARVLGTDAEGCAVLRKGLDAAAPLLQAGGSQAAAKAGVLADEHVVRALAAVGGPVAGALLVQSAARALPAIRKVLRDHLLKLALPAPETAVLLSHEMADTLPRDYLEGLLLAVQTRRFDSMQAQTGELLRRQAEQPHERTALGARLEAIANLVHAPGPETEALLARLARAGRFYRLGPKARAIRRCASRTLATIRKGTTK